MAWLFERTVEVAAWAAMFFAWASAAMTVYFLARWAATLMNNPDGYLLFTAGQYGATFVGFSVALGALACIDRFLFDADE